MKLQVSVPTLVLMGEDRSERVQAPLTRLATEVERAYKTQRGKAMLAAAATVATVDSSEQRSEVGARVGMSAAMAIRARLLASEGPPAPSKGKGKGPRSSGGGSSAGVKHLLK